MPTFTYRNKSELPQQIPNIGAVAAGKTIVSNEPINNANFELVDTPQAPQSQATPNQQPQQPAMGGPK